MSGGRVTFENGRRKMTYVEVLETAKKLSPAQRRLLIEAIARSLEEEKATPPKRPSSLARVRGMLKVNGAPPSDDELSDDYTEYLIKKYI
jgi:hypothetical protein